MSAAAPELPLAAAPEEAPARPAAADTVAREPHDNPLRPYLLLRRLPARQLLLTSGVGLVAAATSVGAFHFGFADDATLRGAHPAGPAAAIALCLTGYFAMQVWFGRRVWRHFEDAVAHARANILRLASTSELPVLTGVGATRLASIVNGDARVVLASTTTLALTAMVVALSVVGSVTVAFQSLPALGVFLGSIVVSAQFLRRHGDTRPLLEQADAPESRFREVLDDVLGGPRELSLDRRAGLDAAASAAGAARAAASLGSAAVTVFGVSLTIVCALFGLFQIALGELAHGVVPAIVVTTETAMLLAALPRVTFAVLMQEEQRSAARAARRLMVLEAGLAAAPRVAASTGSLQAFQVIALDGVALRRGKQGEADAEFVFGPVDITLRRGTVTIVRGPNGSGKSTFGNILLGLLKPAAGRITVDGVPLGADVLESYRALFSPVFADPHLHERLYGYAAHDARLARLWLERLDLPGDIDIHASTRQSAALSTGQRKRLALARALVEERPILVLDEYTADQDADARRRFYEEILPALKAAGKTVVAIVHEEVWPACADQLVRVADGRLLVEQRSPPARPG